MNDPAIIFILLAAPFILVGGVLYNKGKRLMKHGRRAQAIIFKNVLRTDTHGQAYYPVVRFLTERNERITQELSIGYSEAKTEGQKIEIVYDPLDPTIVEINSPFQLEALPKLFLTIGIAALLVALGIALRCLF